jgi:mannose-6-phosphate isomerase class I
MKIVKLEKAEKFNNSDKCEVLEYPLEDADINCATAKITGRYPEKGYCVNEQCKELIYVIEGYGTLNKKEESISFKKGDVILIDKGEIYFWDGNCEIVMPCTPAWYPEQHKLIEED